MSTRSIRACKVAVLLSLLVVCGTARGMLKKLKEYPFADTLNRVGKTSLNFLTNHKESVATLVGGSILGAVVTKLFSGGPNGDIPRAPSLNLSKKKEDDSKEAESVSEFLEISKEKVHQILGLTEDQTIPEDWLDSLSQEKKECVQSSIGGAVQLSELELKQYKQNLGLFFKGNVPKPCDFHNAFKKKLRRAVSIEKKEAQLKMLRLRVGIMNLFGDDQKESSAASLEEIVGYLNGKLNNPPKQ